MAIQDLPELITLLGTGNHRLATRFPTSALALYFFTAQMLSACVSPMPLDFHVESVFLGYTQPPR